MTQGFGKMPQTLFLQTHIEVVPRQMVFNLVFEILVFTVPEHASESPDPVLTLGRIRGKESSSQLRLKTQFVGNIGPSNPFETPDRFLVVAQILYVLRDNKAPPVLIFFVSSERDSLVQHGCCLA